MSAGIVIALAGLVVTICGGVGTIVVYAVKIGVLAGEIRTAQTQILQYLPDLKQAAADRVRLGTVEERERRNTSDIRKLLLAQARSEGEDTGRFRALSEPDLGGNGR